MIHTKNCHYQEDTGSAERTRWKYGDNQTENSTSRQSAQGGFLLNLHLIYAQNGDAVTPAAAAAAISWWSTNGRARSRSDGSHTERYVEGPLQTYAMHMHLT
jgi:hypothetical protein